MDADTRFRRMQAGLIAQLFTSHVLTLTLTWLAVLRGQEVSWPRLLLALGMAGLLGLGLTTNLHRALLVLYRALDRLNHMLPTAPLKVRRLDPLGPLLGQLNDLSRRDVGSLRQSLQAQIREAAAQEERKRLARDLHDSIKQQLFSIHVSAAAVGARWETDPAGAQAALYDVRNSVREAMVEMDALLQQLSPAPLEKVGLVEAIRQQAEALGYRSGAQVEVQIDDLPPDERLPLGAQEALFRVAQETLSNVARHARAQQVLVRLHVESGHLHLTVTDDGQGFDTDAPVSGMGLANMRARLLRLDGRLQVTSQPGEGTSLHASFPLVDALSLQEDTMNRIDHTLNKLFAVSIGGGLAIIAALYLPLYVLLPGQYLTDWPTTPEALGYLLAAVAIGLAVGTGWLAVRWTKPGTRWLATLFGATAGLFAALIAFIGIGAGAAGVVGARPLLEWGFRPADGHLHLLQLTIESTLGIFAWNYRVLWGAGLSGAGLGVLGSLLVPIRDNQLDSNNLRRSAALLLNLGIVAASLALTLHVPLWPRVQVRFLEVVAAWRMPLSHPVELPFHPSAVAMWPVSSAALLFVMLYGARYRLQHADARSDDVERLLAARTSGLMLAAWPVVVGVFLLWVVPGTYLAQVRLPLMVTGGYALILAAGYGVDALRSGRQLARRGVATRSTGRQVGGTVLGLALFAAASMLLFLPGLNGWSRNGLSLTILNNLMGAFNIGYYTDLGYPYVLPVEQVPFLGQYAVFFRMPFLKTALGLLGVGFSRWLLTAATANLPDRVRSTRRLVVQAAAGTLLGLILISSFAITLPASAATSFNMLIANAVGQELFRGGGAIPDPYAHGTEHIQVMPLWPLSYYGPDVTELPARYTDQDIADQMRFTGQSEAEVRAELARYMTAEYAVYGAYRQQFIEPVAYPIVMLILGGLIWLGVAGVDALAWRRAKELAQQVEEDRPQQAASR